MKESCSVKISAFPIYRFFRNELPAMTKASLACVVLFGLLAFVIFSPGFSFKRIGTPTMPIASLELSKGNPESGLFQDSEPLFLPTRWNFGATNSPKELSLRETSFLPFGEMLFLGSRASDPAMQLKYKQNPPSVETALSADAWPLIRGFGVGIFELPVIEKAPSTRVRIENADVGKIIFDGALGNIVEVGKQILLAPAEFLCGITSGYGLPRIMTVYSCGDSDRDAQIEKEISVLLKSLNLKSGIYRIFVDFR